MRKKLSQAFTLTELLVVVVIVGVLTTVGVAGYQGYRDRAATMVDETNLQVLSQALKTYAYDNDALPAGLSELPHEYVDRALVQLRSERKPYTLLAHAQTLWREFLGEEGAAYAFLPPRYINNDIKILQCPSDSTPPTAFDGDGRPVGGVSYALNPQLAGAPLKTFLRNDAILIFEADELPAGNVDPDSSEAPWVFRHQTGGVLAGLTAGGNAIAIRSNGKVITRHRRTGGSANASTSTNAVGSNPHGDNRP